MNKDMSNTSNNPTPDTTRRIEVELPEEIYHCLACGYVGTDVGEEDECAECECRYRPNQDGNGESCPDCGSDFYENTCPACGAGGGDFATLETAPADIREEIELQLKLRKQNQP